MADATSAKGNGSQPDGRQLRGARTRRAIFEAYVQLLHEGADPPRMEQIAERAGVGTRTVYNQFRDLEGLRTEVGSQLFREWAVYALGEVPAGAPRRERLRIFLDARTRFLVVLAPYARTVQGYHQSSPVLRRQRDQLVAISRREIKLVFAPELARHSGRARTRLLNALHAASSWPAWYVLRDELGLAVPEATAVMKQTLEALLQADLAEM
jgi:TetR/AcrR family transcriptional regulator, regulator of autoinduction and epiphytic fitness